jgi:hypothetical protein
MGGFRYWWRTKCMLECGFSGMIGSEFIGFYGSQFRFVVETLPLA